MSRTPTIAGVPVGCIGALVLCTMVGSCINSAATTQSSGSARSATPPPAPAPTPTPTVAEQRERDAYEAEMNAKMAAKAKRELAEAEAYERERDRREAAERDAADARALFGNGETSVGSGEQGVYVQYSGSAGYRGPSISSGRRRPAAGQGSGRIDRRNKVNGGAGRGRRR